MNFADRVKQAIEAVDSAPRSIVAIEFRRTLEEFACGLSMSGIGADVRDMRDPRTAVLRTYPKHRPAQAREVLRFTLDGHEIVVSGDVPKRISSPSGLMTWLLGDILLGSMFPRMVRDLREAAESRASARICYDARTMSATDIMVTMSADQHRAACEADMETETEIRVAVDWLVFGHRRQRGVWADCFREVDAEGVLFRVASVEEDEAGLRLRVARVTPAAPDARPVAPHLPST